LLVDDSDDIREIYSAFFVDAGGPMEPLFEAVERHRLTPTHVLLTHHHHDHVSEVAAIAERWPGVQVLIHPAERGDVPGATGTMEAGATVRAGGLDVQTLHTPGHTAGMLSLLVDGNCPTRRVPWSSPALVPSLGPDVFLGDRTVDPLGDGDHAASAFELSDDTGPLPRSKRDRVGRDLRRCAPC